MNKLLICIPLFLNGCSLFQERVEFEFVEVWYPMLVCPAPPVVERPDLYISKLTEMDRTDYGKIAQYYEVTLEQLITYIDSLELVIDSYDKTSKEYEKIKEDFEKTKNK